MNGVLEGPRGSRWAAEIGPSVVEDPAAKTRTEIARPWNVIVHDDPVTLMSYVTNAFMEVFGYPREKAHRLMMEVHSTGRSVVWTGAREQAEVYTQRLQARYLLTTLERVDG